MPPPPSFGTLADAAPPGPPAADSPLRIAVFADLSARPAARTAAELSNLKAVPVDPDDLDTAVAAVAPAVRVSGILGGPVDLAFYSLDDFHPDAIVPQAEKFGDLDDAEAKSDYMKAILRSPRVKALEAAWRGVDWLARKGRKGDRRVELRLYDLRIDELVAAANASEDLGATPLYRSLVEKAVLGPEGVPWAFAVGLYAFPISATSAQLLGRIAKIMIAGGGPFVAGVGADDSDPARAIAPEAAAAWAALRALPEAAAVALSAPRFLLRPPYGENTRSIEAFDFEEYTSPADAAGYVWAAPGLAAAGALAQGLAANAWRFGPAGGGHDLTGLPLHTVLDDDGDRQVTLVERWLDRKGAERLQGLGVIPVMGVRGKDAVRLDAIFSAGSAGPNQPPTPLYARFGPGGPAPPPSWSPGFGVATALGAAAQAASVSAVIQAPPPPAPAPISAPVSGPAAAPEPPAEPAAAPADDGLDPELAALLAGLDEAPAGDPAPPADDGLDPELAALLKDLG